MPLYEYKCKKCGEVELNVCVDDRDKVKCPECGGGLKRMLFKPAIAFKGSGFYCTDSNPKPIEQKVSSNENKSAKESNLNKGNIKRN